MEQYNYMHEQLRIFLGIQTIHIPLYLQYIYYAYYDQPFFILSNKNQNKKISLIPGCLAISWCELVTLLSHSHQELVQTHGGVHSHLTAWNYRYPYQIVNKRI